MAKSVSRQSQESPAARITREIITRLEAGTRPWVRPWRGRRTCRPLRACGIPYRGLNVFWLWLMADLCGFNSPYWMTYRQAAQLGGQVRKGEKSTIAIFYKSYAKEAEAPDTGERTSEARRVLKAYAIFSADQVDGLPERYYPEPEIAPVEPAGRQADLDAFFGAIPAQMRHHGDEAYYEPTADRITMPSSTLFTGFDHYYATLAHEVGNIASVLVSRTALAVERCFSWIAESLRGSHTGSRSRLCFAASGREF